MNLISNHKIGVRLGYGLAIIVTSMILLAAITIFTTGKIVDTTTDLYEHPLVITNSVKEIKIHVTAMHRSLKDIAMSRTDEQLNAYIRTADQHEQSVLILLELISERYLGNKADVQAAETAFAQWPPIRQEVIDLIRNGNSEQAAEITRSKGDDYITLVNAKLQIINDFALNKAETFLNNAHNSAKNLLIIMSALVLLTTGIFALYGTFLTKSIAEPLRTVMHGISYFADGNLDHKIILNNHDEIGLLANAFNNMAAKLKKTTASRNQLDAANQQLQAANQQLNAANQQLLAVEQQLRASNQQLKAEEQQLNALNQQLMANHQDLQQSKAIYKAMFDFTMSAIAVYQGVNDGNDFILKDFNPAAEKIDNVKKQNVLNKNVTDVFPGIEKMGLLDTLKRVWKTGSPESLPLVQYKDDRINGWRENYVFKSPTGEVVAVYRDLTELKKAEETLKLSEEKFRLVTETIEDVFWMSTCGVGKMVYVSPAYETLWQRSRESLYHSPISFTEIIHPDDRDKYLDIIEKNHNLKKPYECDFRIIRNDGEIRWIHEKGFPTYSSLEKTDLMTGICTDITARVIAKQNLKDNQEKLRALTSRLSSIEEKERKHIAEGIHDSIIQPLIFLDVKIKSLLTNAHDEKIADSFRQMRTILSELIEKSRTFTFDLSHPILYELGLEAAMDDWLHNEIIHKHKLAVTFHTNIHNKDLDQTIATFLFKSAKELLINVVKHADAKNVNVNVTRENNIIILSVEDDGCGFNNDESKSKKSKITGFGLFNIREQLTYLGGSFNIHSEPGAGTCISLTVPLQSKIV